ncbi:CheR family methyltransferase [Paraconexibacter algicola]|uniref:Chemotaxis protein CheR n=1 Tax=Paraconexibacter algicola TaxID=2133960 RepID=A0A2T4UIU6_9ACTN|nr:protein-glutamate O-methyltransferase CheR [Paraconexibacter algicola]PTL59162.1 chemotaxis protein CheR [Paraconexibacter algicola]
MSIVERTAHDPYPEFTAGLRRLTGIDLDQYKRPQMERRIRTWITARHGDDDLLAELRRLRADDEELDAFLDRMTINVSQLWRNPEQWERIGRDVLPDLRAAGPARPLRIWSAGCSYGAEAYTLAAHVLDAGPGVRAEIVGTDIDNRVVARARRGIFSDADARDAPRDALLRHFEQTADGTWAARPALRALVRFEQGDLLRVRPRREHHDLILCRNTVIYFTEEVRDALHERLVEALRPGGYLIVGATERVARAADLGLEPTHPFTYRKVG